MVSKKGLSRRNARIRRQPNPTNPRPPAPYAQPPSAQPIGSSNANATNVWIPVDSYLVRHYGWQTADVAGCMASIICYSTGVLIGYVNFFNSEHVPQSTISSFSPPQLLLTINYPVERVQEMLETLRCEATVHIDVDLSQRVGWVGIDPATVGHVAN